MTMSWLRRIVKYVRESGIDSAVLLVAGVAAALLGLLGVANAQLMLSIGTALLATVAAVLLRSESRQQTDRESADRLRLSIDSLLARLDARAEPGRVLQFEYPDLRHCPKHLVD